MYDYHTRKFPGSFVLGYHGYLKPDMANPSSQTEIHGGTPRILFIILLVGLLSSCSFGPPETRAHITNVRAKPDSHSIAVALKYEKLQEPTGINSFPNGGIPKMLDQKAKIYVCDAETAQVKRVAIITPEERVKIGWKPWILGWLGDSLFFKVSGQAGTSLEDIQNSRPIIYRIDADGRVSKLAETPENLEFQSNTGPLPRSSFVRYSKGYDTIDVRTDKTTELRTRFKTEIKDGELVPVIETNK
jgi:hypothetical protein